MGVEWKFKICVLDSDYQSAKRTLGFGEQTDSDDSVFEIEEKTATDNDFNQDYEARSRAYLNHWDPELATVEVGSQPPTDESSTVELSLTVRWSGRPDLNRGPPAPKAGALPGCATPRQ